MPSKICVKLKTEVRLRPNRPPLSREQRLMDVLDLECGKNVLHGRIAQAVSASAHRLDAPRHLPSNGGRPLHIAADHLRWSRQYPDDRGHVHTVRIPFASRRSISSAKGIKNGRTLLANPADLSQCPRSLVGTVNLADYETK